jgi:hypothetical protein
MVPMRFFVAGLALCSLALGCSPRLDVILRHPLEVGQVDQPNTVVHGDWQATLTRLDPEAVCVDVTFDAEQPHQPPNVELPSQELLMKAGDEWYRDAQVVELRPTQTSSYEGTVLEQYQAGTIRECTQRNQNGECDRWEDRPRYESRFVPATWFRSVGSGVVCFPNHGRVTLQTTRVVFTINRVHFRWGLESVIQEPVQPEQTSGGENEG